MTSDTLGTVIAVSYVLVSAVGVLPHLDSMVNTDQELHPGIARLRTDGLDVWATGDPGSYSLVDPNGRTHSLTVGQVYPCHGRYEVVPGTVALDAMRLDCWPYGEGEGESVDGEGEGTGGVGGETGRVYSEGCSLAGVEARCVEVHG